MSPKSQAASLVGSFLAKKGDAAPTPINDTPDETTVTAAVVETPELQPENTGQGRAPKQVRPATRVSAPPPPPLVGVKSLTVKLDAERYEALVTVGFHRRRSNQEMMVEAFDQWIAKNRIVQQ